MAKDLENKIEEEKKVKTTIDNNSNVSDEESQFYTNETEEPNFFKYRIMSQVTGIKPNIDDNTKVQVQTKIIDKVTGDLIEETFTLNNENGFTDDILKSFYKKNIRVEDVTKYEEIVRNTQTKRVENRIKRYGATLDNLKVLDNNQELELPFYVNKYCKVRLISVAPILKKGKVTGDVKLISMIEESYDQRTFVCILKGSKDVKWDAKKFDKMINKEVYVSDIISKDNNRERTIEHFTERAPRIELK